VAQRPTPSARAIAFWLAAAGLAGCSSQSLPRFGAPAGATQQSHHFIYLWQGTFITAMVIGGLVWGLIFWSIIRYRKRPGDETLPKQTRYHIPLEITYTAIPVVIVAVIFGFNVHAERKVDQLSKNPAVTVKVEGFQWGWRFSYLRADGSVIGPPVVGTEVSIPTLVLPEDETVLLQLRSDDVIHSFFVPDFLFKRDLIPGVNNDVDFYIDRVGTFEGHCAEFCGIHHTDMNFVVRAVTRQEFDSMIPGAGR
jgi:cytochrome c oxidase subunit 2